MDFNALNVFLEQNLSQLQQKYGFKNKESASLLAKTVKLSEETGEFSENILKYLGYQRSEKPSADIEAEIQEEYADLVITASLILKELDLSIEDALTAKINKIAKRGGV